METWCKVKVDEASEEVDKVRKEVEANSFVGHL
jgi:hypothetical protein